MGLDLGQGAEDAGGMAVGRVEHDHVHPGLDQGLGARQHLGADADGRSGQQPAHVVLGGVRVLLDLLDVLDGDQPFEPAILVDDEQLLDAVLVEQGLAVRQVDAHRGGDQVLAGHDVVDAQLVVGDEPQVAVGDDAHQLVTVEHRQAGDTVVAHDRLDIGDALVARHGDRVDDHAGFGFLDLLHLLGLTVDAHVLVDDTDAALASHGDGGLVLGDRVHGGAEQRGLQFDRVGQTGCQGDLRRQDLRGAGHHEDIVKGEGQGDVVVEHGDSLSAESERGAPLFREAGPRLRVISVHQGTGRLRNQRPGSASAPGNRAGWRLAVQGWMEAKQVEPQPGGRTRAGLKPDLESRLRGRGTGA